MHEPPPGALGEVGLRLQRRLQGDGGPRVPVVAGQLLVGDQFRLHDDPGAAVDGRHLEGDRGDGPLGERHQTAGADADGGAGRGGPLAGAGEQAGAQVEDAFVGTQPSVAHVERLVATSSRSILPLVTLMTVCPDSG